MSHLTRSSPTLSRMHQTTSSSRHPPKQNGSRKKKTPARNELRPLGGLPGTPPASPERRRTRATSRSCRPWSGAWRVWGSSRSSPSARPAGGPSAWSGWRTRAWGCTGTPGAGDAASRTSTASRHNLFPPSSRFVFFRRGGRLNTGVNPSS